MQKPSPSDSSEAIARSAFTTQATSLSNFAGKPLLVRDKALRVECGAGGRTRGGAGRSRA